MNRYLSEEHNVLVEEVRAFAQESIAPIARSIDESKDFPWENIKKMADMGLMGVPIPQEFGGMGRDYLSYILVVEELAKVDASHAITVSAHTTLGTSPILQFGNKLQRDKYLPLLAGGKVISGFGLTEPGAGSDAGGTRTKAVRENGGYRINGSKIFITHAGVGEIFIITAVTDPDKGTRGISSFIVCKPTVDLDITRKLDYGHDDGLPFLEGVRSGKKEDKMGWRASDTRELLIENVLVPESHILGEEGEGFINFMKTLDAGRIGIAALSLGLAEGAFETALQYTNQREQFGKKIWNFQNIQFQLADIATDIEAGKHLTYYAAWLKDNGQPFTKEAAMAKLFCSELAMRATQKAIQVMGGSGYTADYPVERMMRDAKVCEIGEGTNEIQRLVIGRELIKEAFGESVIT